MNPSDWKLKNKVVAAATAIFCVSAVSALDIQHSSNTKSTELSQSARYKAYEKSVKSNPNSDVQLYVVNGYTPAALAYANGNVKSVLDTSSRAVAKTNLAFKNSGIHLHLNLVETVETNGDANSIKNEDASLGALNNSQDRNFASLKQARIDTHSDFAMLFDGVHNGGGVAGINAGSSNFTIGGVVNYQDQSNPIYETYYVHEFGHLIGLDHDRFVSGQGKNMSLKNFGYVNLKHGVVDVMAYQNACDKIKEHCRVYPAYSGQYVKTTEGYSLGDRNDDGAGFVNSRLADYANMPSKNMTDEVLVSSSVTPGQIQVSKTASIKLLFSEPDNDLHKYVSLESADKSKSPSYTVTQDSPTQVTIHPSVLSNGLKRVVIADARLSQTRLHEMTIPFSVGYGPSVHYVSPARVFRNPENAKQTDALFDVQYSDGVAKVSDFVSVRNSDGVDQDSQSWASSAVSTSASLNDVSVYVYNIKPGQKLTFVSDHIEDQYVRVFGGYETRNIILPKTIVAKPTD